MDEDKQQRSAWSNQEKTMATRLIVTNYNKLYGKFEGANLGKKEKLTEWAGIAQSVNSTSKSSKYTVKQIQKMFSNLKSRALHKNSSNQKTGAGPHSSLTGPEEMVLEIIKSKPQTRGIVGGLDSEDKRDDHEDSDASNESENQLEEMTGNNPKKTKRKTSTSTSSSNNLNTSMTTSTSSLTTSTTSTSSLTTSTLTTATKTTSETPVLPKSAGLPKASSSGEDNRGCRRKTRRRREDEEDLFAIEAKRVKIEIERQETELELAKLRILHDKELFNIRKQLLEVHLKRAIDENLFNIEL